MKDINQMDWFPKQKLAAWGISVIPRPDYWDNRNRRMTLIIDESIADDTIIVEDGISFRMSVTATENLIEQMVDQICDDFMELFVSAVNAYAKWNMILIKKASGISFLKQAVERIQFVLDIYHVGIKQFQQLDYWKCVRHFGGERNFRQIVFDAVCYNRELIEEMTPQKCLICKHCKCLRSGERICRKVFVPVEEGRGVRTLRIVSDVPISNKLADILPTFEQREECSCFEQNGTKIIDWAVRFRNAHF